MRKRVTIWVVRVGDEIYIRPVNGRESGWFRGTQVRGEGHIWAGGIEKAVDFVEESDPEINGEIDGAYQAKYRRYPQYVPPVLTAKSRSATIKLVPRSVDS